MQHTSSKTQHSASSLHAGTEILSAVLAKHSISNHGSSMVQVDFTPMAWEHHSLSTTFPSSCPKGLSIPITDEKGQKVAGENKKMSYILELSTELKERHMRDMSVP